MVIVVIVNVVVTGGRGRRAAARSLARGLLALVVCAGAVACGDGGAGRAAGPSAAPGGTAGAPPRGTAGVPATGAAGSPALAGDVATNLDTPWGLALLPDGDALVASRDTGVITRVGPGTPSPAEVGRVPGAVHRGEGGLLGLALSPSFASDALVYAYLTTDQDNRIVRVTYRPGQPLGAPEVVLSGIPAGNVHNGGRIAFGPDGMLYAGTGEAGRRDPAQDPESLGGKILRVTPDGAPAPGNPFPGSPVYSLGHRNVQGLAWDGAGRLWASEFGQDTWDELNLIRPGANYGWPRVEGRAGDPRYVDPVAQWPTDEASPSGVAVLGDAVYLAALKGERLWRVPIPGGVAGTPEDFLTGDLGRLRTVVAVGGGLWLTTSNTDGRGEPRPGDDRIVRLTVP